jgi:guanylate kinase
MKHKLFVISAPSGAGKTTLVNKTIEELSSVIPIKRVVTYTTKEPRKIEKHKEDYHFLSIREFEQKIKEGFFLEWSKAYDNYYGCPVDILNQLKSSSFVLVVDRLGAQSLKKILSSDVAFFIWIRVHNLEVLKERLINRGTESLSQIERRLEVSAREINREISDPLFECYIYNECFEMAVKDLKEVILEALKE